MPYAEECSRERCKWIGCKIGSGKCDRKTAVLHPDFDRNGVAFHIHTKSLRLQNQAHACKIVKHYNSENRKTGCQDLFCIDSSMPLMIMTIDTTEIRGRMPEIFSICLPMIHRRKMPRSTGIRTTFTAEITILKKETSTHAPARGIQRQCHQ